MTRVEEIFQEGLDRKVYSAGAAAVGKGNDLYLELTGGTVSYDPGAAPVTCDTQFDMASCSKIFGTTMVAYHLIERGYMTLLDQLGDYFPDCPEDKKRITIKHLMTHTSGLPDEILLWKYAGSPDNAVDTILQHPLAYPTGKGCVYSCMGFILLAKIMEQITGKPLNVLADQWTFKPLGMTRTGYHPVDTCQPDPTCAFTEVNTLWGPGQPGIVHDENARFLNGISGNAGVFSTLRDSETFCRMLAAWGQPILSERMLRVGSVNYTPGFDDNRGLGLQLGGPAPSFTGDLWGDHCICHTGFTGTSFAVDLDTGLWLVYLTNRVYPTRSNGGLTRLRHQIHNAAMKEFGR